MVQPLYHTTTHCVTDTSDPHYLINAFTTNQHAYVPQHTQSDYGVTSAPTVPGRIAMHHLHQKLHHRRGPMVPCADSMMRIRLCRLLTTRRPPSRRMLRERRTTVSGYLHNRETQPASMPGTTIHKIANIKPWSTTTMQLDPTVPMLSKHQSRHQRQDNRRHH